MASVTEAFNIALEAHQVGRFQEAEALYQEILKHEPANADALHLLGVLSLQTGRVRDAIRLTRQSIDVSHDASPKTAGYYLTLGNALQAEQEWAGAEEAFQQASVLDAEDAQPHISLGVLYRQQGELKKAETCYREALRRSPDLFALYNNLGNVLKAQGLVKDAIEQYREAIGRSPDFYEAHYNLALLLEETGDRPAAIAHCHAALTAAPGFAEAAAYLGTLYFREGRYPEAIQAYEQAIAINPTLAKAYYNLATIHQNTKNPEQAVFNYIKALEIDPDYSEALFDLGNALHQQGYFDEAKVLLQRACKTHPGHLGWQLRAQGLCPIIPQSEAQIARLRQEIAEFLEGLLQRPVADLPPLSLEDCLYSICEPSYYLPYHGQADAPLKSLYGKFYERLLSHQYPWMTRPPTAPARNAVPKIAFLVTEHHENVFCKLMLGFLNRLSRKKFNVTVICPSTSVAFIQSRLEPDALTHFLPLPGALEAAVSQIKPQGFDAIVFFEVGTCALNYFLPFFRLAPVQCTTWGFPVTSGVPAVDYFLSSQWIEVPEAAAHYSESLVKFNNALPTYFYRPTLPAQPKSRTELGLPETGTLYVCPQSLFKLHPDFDPMVAEILRQDPIGTVVLLQAGQPYWNDLLKARLAAQMPEAMNRIIFLPRQSYPDYLTLLHRADVILDPTHYTGSITTLEALAFGTPIVTLPDETFRGRVTLACYEAMEYFDCVAATPTEYVALALKLGKDAEYRQAVRAEILKRNQVLYENPRAVEALETFFMEAIEAAQKGPEGATELREESPPW